MKLPSQNVKHIRAMGPIAPRLPPSHPKPTSTTRHRRLKPTRPDDTNPAPPLANCIIADILGEASDPYACAYKVRAVMVNHASHPDLIACIQILLVGFSVPERRAFVETLEKIQ